MSSSQSIFISIFLRFFRWIQEENEEKTFLGVFANIVWRLKASDSHLHYSVLGELPYPQPAEENIVRMKIPEPKRKKAGKCIYQDSYYENLLKAFFRLDFDLETYYAKWTEAHQHFASKQSGYQNRISGIRQLDIDCVENLFSFICSQNNNISRISSLVNKLCSHYGEKICEVDGQEYFAFPELSALSKDGVEENLRKLGFGYRAKYIQKSAEEIQSKGGLKWFSEVRGMAYEEAHAELNKLTGIGPKVADCICLMSLNHLSAIPVDTHIIQIAKHYLPEVANIKNMTPTLYRKIGNEFRRVYGEFSGWAQTVLFCAELSGFKKTSDESTSVKSKKHKKAWMFFDIFCNKNSTYCNSNFFQSFVEFESFGSK